MGTVTQLAVSAPPEMAGYVEAVTADRVLGWAWSPRDPALRASVALRLGDDVVARAVADLPRADLASSGIGDGSHAFALAIPEACQGRAAELRVFAQAGDGPPVPIGQPPAAEALSGQVGRVLRGLDVLVGSQRALHRALQAALASRQDTLPNNLAEQVQLLANTQAAMAGQLSDVERFVVRLDQHLSALAQPGAGPRGVPRAALWALAVAGCALVAALAGLVRSLGF